MENEPTVTLSLEGADTAARFDLQAGVLLYVDQSELFI